MFFSLFKYEGPVDGEGRIPWGPYSQWILFLKIPHRRQTQVNKPLVEPVLLVPDAYQCTEDWIAGENYKDINCIMLGYIKIDDLRQEPGENKKIFCCGFINCKIFVGNVPNSVLILKFWNIGQEAIQRRSYDAQAPARADREVRRALLLYLPQVVARLKFLFYF